jgi:hypothetical protein
MHDPSFPNFPRVYPAGRMDHKHSVSESAWLGESNFQILKSEPVIDSDQRREADNFSITNAKIPCFGVPEAPSDLSGAQKLGGIP